MKSIISIAFLLQAIINAVNLTTAQFPAEAVYRCRNTGNYTPRSDYYTNVKTALNTVANMNKYSGGFFNSTYGTNEAAYFAALCSGVAVKWGGNCNDCVRDLSISLITAKCPDQKEAVIWGSNCMIRYSDRKIFGVVDDWGWIFLPERGGVPNTPVFDKALLDLMTRLQGEAAGGTESKKSAFGKITYSPQNRNVYGTMQCTGDLSKEQCTNCLQSIMISHHPCCSGKTAARMLSPNCFFSYSHEDFSKWKT